MSAVESVDKDESESIYEPVSPLPLHVEKDVGNIPLEMNDSLESLEKPNQPAPHQQEQSLELSQEKIPGLCASSQGKRQTGFDILKSKAADAADHVKQQIRSVIPVRQTLTQDQWAKMGQRHRLKLKHGQGERESVEEHEPSLDTDTSEPDKPTQGQSEPISKTEEKVMEVTTKATESESEQREIGSVDELDTVSGTTKRKYIRHRRQLSQMPNPIVSLRNQVEDLKTRLKRSLTPPRIQVRGKRRRSRSADASRATSQEPESTIGSNLEAADKEEEGDNLAKIEKLPNVTLIEENTKILQKVETAPTISKSPVAARVELTEEAVPPPPRPPRPASTLSTPASSESPSMFQTFPLERPKQKQPQGYVSKFMKEHPLEESYASIENAPEVKQVTEHDYETISEGPAKPIRRRRKQPKLPPTPSSFQFNTIAANEWRKEFEKTGIMHPSPAPPVRQRRDKQKSCSVSGSEAEVVIKKEDEEKRVLSNSVEPNVEKDIDNGNVKAISTNTVVPTTFPRKKKKGPKCLQETNGGKDPGRPPPSMFINIMQGRPLPPPPRPDRSRGSLNSLEQSSIEMSVGFRHYAHQSLGLESGLASIPSGAVVDTPFTYPSTSTEKKEREAIVQTQTTESLLMSTNKEPSSSSSQLPEEPVNDKINTVNDAIIHSESQQSFLLQTPVDSSQSEGIMKTMMKLPSASVALGGILLRFTSRSLQAMANYVETASSDDPVVAEAQRANKKVLLCILLVLVVGLILTSNRDDNTYVVPSWELWMPPPDIW